MAVLRSGASVDELTIDPTSKAARVTLYDSSGNALGVQGRATYVAATTANVVAPAGTTSFLSIGGSGTKTLRIYRVRITGDTLTTLAVNSIQLRKYSTAITGGTATALTAVPLDSTSAAATATTLNVYTAAPTDGTLVGNIGSHRHIQKSSTVAEGSPFSEAVWLFGNDNYTQALVLRGTAQYLGAGFGASPGSAVTLSVEVVWTEE